MARAKAKRERVGVLIAVAVAVAALAGVAAGFLAKDVIKFEQTVTKVHGMPSNITNLSQLSIEGYAPGNFSILQPATLVMQYQCWQIQAQTTEPQAYSIDLGLKNQTGNRPTTHDIIKSVFEEFGIQIVQAKITAFDPSVGTYVGRLYLASDGKLLELDARPTDIIGISSRMGVTVYIKEELLRTYGRKVC